MNLYIPELGDKLTLTKDWTFNLYPETRNELFAGKITPYYTHYNRYNIQWIDSNVLPPMRERDYIVNYPSQDEIKKLCKNIWGNFDSDKANKLYRETEQNCPEYVKFHSDLEEWNRKITEINGLDTVPITIPQGYTLIVDRIYIRKGAKEYSSLSFRCNDYGKSSRFWAKLNECNNIEFK